MQTFLVFTTWIAQHSLTLTSRIVELSMPPLAMRGVQDLPHDRYFCTIKDPQDLYMGLQICPKT